MNPLKRLAGQTAIYGIPGILGRMLGFLLVPLYTRVFLPGDYGTVNVFYAYASFLMVVITYGMETAFFRFNESEHEKDKVFSAGAISLLVSSLAFLILICTFAQPVANWIEYPLHKEYVIWFAWMLALDAMSAIPFARLRARNKAKRFAIIKFTGIFINIGLNLFFLLLCPFLAAHFRNDQFHTLLNLIYRSDWRIEYIFISNLIASAATLLLLFPEYQGLQWKIDSRLRRRMIAYAFPLLFAGMAGMVNETFDRLLLRYLLPPDVSSYQVGIYSACYKISILMTIFIQAYKYAAEPFFFAQSKENDAPATYAKIMDYFVITVSLIFLATMLYLDDFILRLLVGRKYWEGRNVIPILMMANLFLGIYYNLSIWYKLTSRTVWGAWLSAIGTVITLTLNFWWIPLSRDHLIYGYLGSAWATFICYGSMMLLSYLLGRKYFPVPYNVWKFLGYLGFSIFLWVVSTLIHIASFAPRVAFHSLLLVIFTAVVWRFERRGYTSVS